MTQLKQITCPAIPIHFTKILFCEIGQTPFTADATGTERTRTVAMGWGRAVCNDSHRSIYEPRVKTTKMAARLLKSTWIKKKLQKRRQSFADVPPPLQDILDVVLLLLLLVWLQLCLHHMPHFSDQLFSCPEALSSASIGISKSNPEDNNLLH